MLLMPSQSSPCHLSCQMPGTNSSGHAPHQAISRWRVPISKSVNYMHHHTSHHGEDGGSSTSLPDYNSLDGELDTISSQPRKTYSIERFSLLQLALYVPIMKNLFPTCSRIALLLELFGSESWLPASFLSMEPWTGYHLLSSRTNFQRRQSKVLRWLLMAETIWKLLCFNSVSPTIDGSHLEDHFYLWYLCQKPWPAQSTDPFICTHFTCIGYNHIPYT